MKNEIIHITKLCILKLQKNFNNKGESDGIICVDVAVQHGAV